MGVLDNLAALKGGYELGQAVFGQDEASRKQALMEKQLGLESALRVKQLEDEQAYRQGALANDQERNRIMDVQGIRNYGLGTGELSARNRGIEVQRELGLAGVDTARRDQNIRAHNQKVLAELEGRRINIDAAYKRGMLGHQEYQDQMAYIDTLTKQAMVGAQVPYYGALRSNAELETKAKQAELQDRDNTLNVRQALGDITFNGKALHEFPEEMQNQLRPFLGYVFNPEHKKNLDVIRTIRPGATLTPEQLGAVSSSVQDYLNEGVGVADSTGAKTSAIRFKSLEPGSEPGKFRVRIAVDKDTFDANGNPTGKVTLGEGDGKNAEPMYITQGRQAIGDGGQPLEVSVDDLSRLVGGMGKLGALHETHPEYLQAGREALGDHQGASSSADVLKNRLARLKEKGGDPSKIAETTGKLRSTLESDSTKQLMDLLGYDEKNYTLKSDTPGESGAPDVARIQSIQGQVAQLKGALQEGIKQIPDDQLDKWTPQQILEKLAPGISKVQQSIIPQAGTAAEPPRTTGGIYNPRSHTGSAYPSSYPRAAGGQPSPLSQAAPSQGGGFFPASYRSQSLGMPKNLQITGTARHFGTEKVDPSLMEGVKAAATLWPGTVDLFSSGRAKTKRERGNHSSWKALDVGLITPEGKYLPNHINKKWHGGGSGAAHEYERFWQAAVLWAAQDDPTILNRFRWGGNFREQDYMHGDTLRGVDGKTTGAGTLFGGRDTRYGGGKTYPVKDLNALGRQLYGDRWRGIPGLARMA